MLVFSSVRIASSACAGNWQRDTPVNRSSFRLPLQEFQSIVSHEISWTPLLGMWHAWYAGFAELLSAQPSWTYTNMSLQPLYTLSTPVLPQSGTSMSNAQ